jgi:L-fucose isomerase
MKPNPIIGVMTLDDPREEVFDRAPEIWQPTMNRHKKVVESLKRGNLTVISTDEIVRTKASAIKCTVDLLAKGIECLLFQIPIWTKPTFAIYIAKRAERAGVPCIIFGDYILSGIEAAHGSLEQLGINHALIWGNLEKESTITEIKNFASAASTVLRLRESTIGVFGGRPWGMYTTTADVVQWQNIFGVDIEHVDQLEIVRGSEEIPADQVGKHIKWLKDNCGLIDYDGKVLTQEKLELQISSYVATKKISEQEGFDFITIKCEPELCDKYVTQCMTPTFMNDPYDADGPKEPIVCACEVDLDGALTMQILKLLTNQPVIFVDLIHLDENGVFACTNCGGLATWYAKRSEDPAVNLREVHLLPQAEGQAGGASMQFVCASAESTTLARLCRKAGKYRMFIFRGTFIETPREKLRETIWPWPHLYFKTNTEPRLLIKQFGANHIHAVVGDYTSELTEFCNMVGIEPIIL